MKEAIGSSEDGCTAVNLPAVIMCGTIVIRLSAIVLCSLMC